MIMSGTDQGEAHLHRLGLFSDAVFVIAITLLAIEIHPPEHWNGIVHSWGWALMAALIVGVTALGRWVARLSKSPATEAEA